MPEWIRFCWNATRGYRLRPWRSPYVLWRVETYTGRKAEAVRLADLARLLWKERPQVIRFARWLSAIRRFGRLRA